MLVTHMILRKHCTAKICLYKDYRDVPEKVEHKFLSTVYLLQHSSR